MKTIYLDYNATTPIDGEVRAAMLPYLEQYFGNPSSTHSFGVEARKAVEIARTQIAALLHCKPYEIIFTSGGTESNNLAIKGVAYLNKHKGNHIITSQIEHPAVIEVCKNLEQNGFRVTYLPVDASGMVNPVDVVKAISPATILITIMHANNEIGTINPLAEIALLAKHHKILFHTDAAQSVGKIETDVLKLGADLLTVAGHKLYAPKGIGALYIRDGVKIEKLIHGADHEQNLRAGTENVIQIVGLGKACEIALRDLEKNSAHTSAMRNRLFTQLSERLQNIVRLNGHPEKRLPNTLSIGFKNVEANTLLSELQGVAASAGAACHTDRVDVSPVLTAIGVPIEFAMGTIRFSTGKYTTADEIDLAANEVVEVVNRLSPQFETPAPAMDLPEEIKLTHFTHGLGCACKIRPQYLERILKDLPIFVHPDVLIGNNTSDDAAVYRINADTAIVQTVDFFTPIVDDPYQFGAIAAANALSDIYAMGAKPLFALNIVGFPDKRLPIEVLKQILQGAADKAKEAGIGILGGHTIEDSEPKFGMVVTGIVHPNKVLSNANAQIDDVLILTKPIGTGIIATAVKRGIADNTTAQFAIEVMISLNDKAAKVMEQFPVNSCTDVTGFGLLGHLMEMSKASRKNVEVFVSAIPIILGAAELVAAGAIPGGTKNNLDYVSSMVDWSDSISEIYRYLLCDAQTSGGLLISVNKQYANDMLTELKKVGILEAAIIGRFVETGDGRIGVL